MGPKEEDGYFLEADIYGRAAEGKLFNPPELILTPPRRSLRSQETPCSPQPEVKKETRGSTNRHCGLCQENEPRAEREGPAPDGETEEDEKALGPPARGNWNSRLTKRWAIWSKTGRSKIKPVRKGIYRELEISRFVGTTGKTLSKSLTR